MTSLPAEPVAPLPDAAVHRQHQRGHHREMLSIALASIVVSAILQVRPDGRVFFPGLTSHPLPESCMSRSVFGVKCPGCGLTRSFISLAHGHWRQSLTYHRLGWLLFLAAAMQVPYRLRMLYGEQAATSSRRGVGRWFGWVLLALLVGNWCAEMLLGRWH